MTQMVTATIVFTLIDHNQDHNQDRNQGSRLNNIIIANQATDVNVKTTLPCTRASTDVGHVAQRLHFAPNEAFRPRHPSHLGWRVPNPKTQQQGDRKGEVFPRALCRV